MTTSSSSTSQVTQRRHCIQGPCYLKMLVDDVVAGCIIGRKGTIINTIENETGCQMKLSPAHVYFPNTRDRIVVISGNQEHIHAALLVILEKIKNYATDHDSQASQNHSTALLCKIVIPKTCVAQIIGKEGAQVKQLQQTSGAKIQISNRDNGLEERIVMISGNLEAIQTAAQSIATSIQSDPNLKNHVNVEYEVPAHAGMFSSIGAATPASFAYNSFPYSPQFAAQGAFGEIMQQPCEISLRIPDNLVGIIIGRNGTAINELYEGSGAKIVISKKGDLVEGTDERKVTISGPVASVHRGHILLMQRIEEAKLLQSSPPLPGGTSRTSTTSSTSGFMNSAISPLYGTLGAAPGAVPHQTPYGSAFGSYAYRAPSHTLAPFT